MEDKKKCSHKKHSESNAVSYCIECNLYLCNKCKNNHLEYLENHHINNLDKNKQEIFTGLCQEINHKIKLLFYCKNHNKLCCAACLCKIKKKGNGQHSECEVCDIEEIKEEKKSKLNENIKYLEESSKNIEESIDKLKEIYEKINKSKEEIKLKISNIFTKIKTMINEREDHLLEELDKIFENSYFKENLIKKAEKIPNQINIFLEKGKLLNNEWDNDNNLINKINDCINIEDNIKNIIAINKSIGNCNSKKLRAKFLPENDQILELGEQIQKFGQICIEENTEFKFQFKAGDNYILSNNGLKATKSGATGWNCVIVGDKEIPKDRISKWKIKINKNKKSIINSDNFIGIGPKSFKGELFNECWSIASGGKNIIKLWLKEKSSNYNNHKEELKEGDIIEIIVDRKLGNLSFSVNGINFGIACNNIPKDDELYPTVVLYEKDLNVEIV